jgi:pimeloyl-ACP methyl ester carboxylesterase
MTTIFKSVEAASEMEVRYRSVLDKWPVANTQLILSTREGKTFVVACGPETAPPLVLLHGSMANSASWMFDAALWSRSFRVYAVDMIGEAGFSAPSRPPLHSDAYAQWLDDVMSGLRLKRAAFVGVSLGGWLGLDYATRRPGRAEQLALLCPSGLGRQKNFLLKAAPLLLFGTWGVRKMREMVLGPTPTDMPENARQLVELMSFISGCFRPRMEKIPRFDDTALRTLTMPMLVIVGGKDVLLDSADTRRRLALTVAHAEVRFLPDARHFIRGQSDVILEFLTRNGR